MERGALSGADGSARLAKVATQPQTLSTAYAETARATTAPAQAAEAPADAVEAACAATKAAKTAQAC